MVKRCGKVTIMFDGYLDDLCPECLLDEANSYLLLNDSDFYECPKCNLQISFREYPIATVLNFRGKGKIRTEKKSISDEDFGAGLAPMDSNSKKFLSTSKLFEDENSFKEYISKIPNR